MVVTHGLLALVLFLAASVFRFGFFSFPLFFLVFLLYWRKGG